MPISQRISAYKKNTSSIRISNNVNSEQCSALVFKRVVQVLKSINAVVTFSPHSVAVDHPGFTVVCPGVGELYDEILRNKELSDLAKAIR